MQYSHLEAFKPIFLAVANPYLSFKLVSRFWIENTLEYFFSLSSKALLHPSEQ